MKNLNLNIIVCQYFNYYAIMGNHSCNSIDFLLITGGIWFAILPGQKQLGREGQEKGESHEQRNDEVRWFIRAEQPGEPDLDHGRRGSAEAIGQGHLQGEYGGKGCGGCAEGTSTLMPFEFLSYFLTDLK